MANVFQVTGNAPEMVANYPGRQGRKLGGERDPEAMKRATRMTVWHAFRNGGYDKDKVPYETLKTIVSDMKIFERNFNTLTDERKAAFMKFFWTSADARPSDSKLTIQLDDAVVVMRENEPVRAPFHGKISESQHGI